MAMPWDNQANGSYIPYDYDSAIRRRLPKIEAIGTDATQYVAQAAQRAAVAQQARDYAILQNAGPKGVNDGMLWQNGSKTGPADDMVFRGKPGGSFGNFMAAISGQESGGNYGARNPSSGAMGKYQIMPANLGGRGSGWDYETLGRDISVSQFMSSPQLQEQIAQHKLQQYYNQYGPAGAAVAWYAGPGAAQKFRSSGRASRSPEGNYPSVSSYMNSILRRMGL